MTGKLLLSAVVKLFLGLLIMCVLIFVPAGTVYFFNGWVLIVSLFVPMVAAGIALYIKKPELLKKRLNSKEKLKSQNMVVVLSAVIFVVGFVVAGLDFRFSLSCMPEIVVIIATLIFFASYLLYGIVISQNPYLSRTVEIQENQKVIDFGLYSIVRHPMYSVTLFMFLSMPLILGSWYAFFVFLLYPFLLIKRIKDEEALLEKKLDGYSEYIKNVKYRLIPFVW